MLDFRRKRYSQGVSPPRQHWRVGWIVFLVGLLVILGSQADRVGAIFRLLGEPAQTEQQGGDWSASHADGTQAPSAVSVAQSVRQSLPASPQAPVHKTSQAASDSSPRELLRVYGLEEAFLARLTEAKDSLDQQSEGLLKLLYRVRSFSLKDMERWSQGRPDPTYWTGDYGQHRGEVFRLSGQAVSVTVLRPSHTVAERFEMAEYYRCEMLLGGGREPAVVYAAKIPRRWRSGGPINERAGALGLYIGDTARKTGGPRSPVFVAQRIAWYPACLLYTSPSPRDS